MTVPATGSVEYHILRAHRGQHNARLSDAGVAALGPVPDERYSREAAADAVLAELTSLTTSREDD